MNHRYNETNVLINALFQVSQIFFLTSSLAYRNDGYYIEVETAVYEVS